MYLSFLVKCFIFLSVLLFANIHFLSVSLFVYLCKTAIICLSVPLFVCSHFCFMFHFSFCLAVCQRSFSVYVFACLIHFCLMFHFSVCLMLAVINFLSVSLLVSIDCRANCPEGLKTIFVRLSVCLSVCVFVCPNIPSSFSLDEISHGCKAPSAFCHSINNCKPK